MKFRFHRASLEESLRTVVELPGRTALDSLLWDHFAGLPVQYPGHFWVEPDGFDARTGWDTYLVLVDGWGVVGMTDGPV